MECNTNSVYETTLYHLETKSCDTLSFKHLTIQSVPKWCTVWLKISKYALFWLKHPVYYYVIRLNLSWPTWQSADVQVSIENYTEFAFCLAFWTHRNSQNWQLTAVEQNSTIVWWLVSEKRNCTKLLPRLTDCQTSHFEVTTLIFLVQGSRIFPPAVREIFKHNGALSQLGTLWNNANSKMASNCQFLRYDLVFLGQFFWPFFES